MGEEANPRPGGPSVAGVGGSGVEALGSGKGPSPSFQLQTKDHLLPCSPSPPGLPAVVLVTGAALWLLLLPPTRACQACP